MFVDDIGVLYPCNNEKIMQIHDNRLIAECTSYDFKEMLERKKVKSWDWKTYKRMPTLSAK